MHDDGVELGLRIAAARQAAGLTQAELSRSISVDRTGLTKIERGTRKVTALELARIAELVGVEVGDFFGEPLPAVVSHRAGRDLEVPLASIDRFIERLARNVELLEGLGVESPSVEIEAMPFPATSAEVERSAEEVRNRLGSDGPVNDLAALAEAIGVSTFCLGVDGIDASGAMMHLRHGAVVFVNGNQKHGPRRITLAHEIGHVVFADEYSIDHSLGDDSTEREWKLDRFGRALLLPADPVAEDWASERGRGLSDREAIVVLASRYRVGTSQLAMRLGELQILSKAEASRLRGVTTTQADFYEFELLLTEELLPPFLPSWYRRGVLRLYRQDQLSPERAVALLMDTIDESELPERPPMPLEAVWSVL